MSVDNRTTLNACDNATGFLGDGPTPAVNTTVGQRYQGSGSIESQHTNADEHMYTTSIGGTRNLATSTVYWLLKDNLVATLANGGIQGVLGDGTDRIGYDMAGNNAPGLDLPPFYRGYKMDVSVVVAAPGVFNAYAGTEANLDQTAITSAGIGTLHLAKAVGNTSNIFLDRMSFHANTAYALTINAGTVGTPITMSTVQADDITNGWGLVARPLGNSYVFHGSTEWGTPSGTANSYFTATDQQWTFLGDNAGGKAIGAGNFIFRLIGNATGTNSWVATRVSMTNVSTRASFNFSNANMDIVKGTTVTMTDFGTITMPIQAVGDKFWNNGLFINCNRMNLSSMDMDGCTWNGSNTAAGAILWGTVEEDQEKQINSTFVRNGTHNAIEIAPTGAGPFTYTVVGLVANGFASQDDVDAVEAEKVFFINPSTLSANININLSDSSAINIGGGADTGIDGFSYRVVGSYTGTVTITQTVTLTATVVDGDNNPIEGARVRFENQSTGALVSQGSTNASGVYTDASFNYTGDLAITTKVRLKGFRNFRTAGTIINTGLSVGVTLQDDNIVDLP